MYNYNFIGQIVSVFVYVNVSLWFHEAHAQEKHVQFSCCTMYSFSDSLLNLAIEFPGSQKV